MKIRPAAVAGMFYPADRAELAAMLDRFLQRTQSSRPAPKALVVPHAGYVYSGQAAADAYAALKPLRERIRRVILLGPSHRVALRGIALPSVDAFETPLGIVPLDKGAMARLQGLPGVGISDLAHQDEHSLEVQVPFLQTVLADFSLLPLVVGETTPEEVARVLDTLWGGEETLVVISSDLSHFLPYSVAQQVDRETAGKILRLRTDLEGEEACGCHPLNGLLYLAKQKGLRCDQVALCNSGDTRGDKRRVVGYGSFALVERAA